MLRLLLSAALACSLTAPAYAAAPLFETTSVFRLTPENKPNYRIPSLLPAGDGTLLAIVEKRNDGPGDIGNHDIVLKRSRDQGRTWSKEQIVLDDENRTSTDLTVARDSTNDRLWIFFLRDKKQFATMSSDDHGRTWQGPTIIHEQVVRPEWDQLESKETRDDGPVKPRGIGAAWEHGWAQRYGVGPGNGVVQINSGAKKGRLLVPARHREDVGGGRLRSFTHCFYTDDHGKSWQLGGTLGIHTSECQFVELADGRVMAIARNESSTDSPDNLRHLVSYSSDAGATWTPPRRAEELITPRCHGSVERLSLASHGEVNRLLFSSPASPHREEEHPYGRYNLTVRLSYDEGETWSAGRTIWPHPGSYSDMVVLPDGTIGCIYERGAKASTHYWDELHFVRFNLEWLTFGRDYLASNNEEAPDLRGSSESEQVIEADVCVYGGTSGGVIAAVQAARMGKKTVLVEPGRHLGGMTSGGLSAVDIGDPRSVGGLAREYFTRLVKRYGQELAWDKPFVNKAGGPATGGAYSIEPHTAEAVFDEMTREQGITVVREAQLTKASKSGARIAEMCTADGRVIRAKMFIDATYEGDLLAAAGVTYTVVREGNAKYGERYNGIYYDEKYRPRVGHLTPGPSGRVKGGQGVWDRDLPLDPFRVAGDPKSGLLPLMNAGEPGKPGEPAPGIQAYCYRLCLTTAADRLPIAPPADYDAARYEIVARFIAACQAMGDEVDLRWFSKYDALPNDKWDFNTATFGGNLPGTNWEWPEASYARRAEIAKQHEDYHRGLLHFLANDERVPSRVRDEMRRFGLPRDEFSDTGGWPHQLFIREGRRMVSELVLTEHHTFGRASAAKPISLGSYGTDTHEIRRIVKDGVVTREGKTAGGRDGAPPYGIGYEAIVPKAAECENLFVTFALSASHTAFSSIRMEPVFMASSQSAATAACLAIDEACAVQQVNYEKLHRRLLDDGQVLEWKSDAATKK